MIIIIIIIVILIIIIIIILINNVMTTIIDPPPPAVVFHLNDHMEMSGSSFVSSRDADRTFIENFLASVKVDYF